jgi:hypothetical protein
MFFSEVEKVGVLLSDLRCEWFVCGGWAIDLFLGRVTREHKDVDIAVARNDQTEVRRYLAGRGWRLEKAVDGQLSIWADREVLSPPVHTVWCRNEEHDPAFVELLLNEIDGDRFRFRRDETITLPRERMYFKSDSGLLVLAPEIVLLYKSSSPEENASDFRNAVVSLSEESRAWLKRALDKVSAQHPWAKEL